MICVVGNQQTLERLYLTLMSRLLRPPRLLLKSCQKSFFRSNSSLSSALTRIRDTQPSLKTSSKHVEILKTPQSFYNTLLESTMNTFVDFKYDLGTTG